MNILFAWTGVTSYMADCWRELAATPGVSFRAVVERVRSGSEIDAARVFRGLDVEIAGPGEEVRAGGPVPDAVFAVGWHSRTVRGIVQDPRLRGVPKVCCFDMPWRPGLRCFAARWALRGFLKNHSAAYVPGESAARYARWLGFAETRKGLFSLDTRRFAGGPGERDFIYIGRDVPEKRIDILRRAYALYREAGGTWKLDFYGGAGTFVQPRDVPALYRSHACLLLASAFDPWPLVLLEATSAGLAAIVSDRCGNADELRARKIPYGDARAMARAMLEAERGGVKPAGPGLAAPYDSREWARRTLEMAQGLAR